MPNFNGAINSPTGDSANSGIAGLKNAGVQANTPSNTVDVPNSVFVMTDGWYLGIWCGFALLTASTRAAAVTTGITIIAIIYQLTLLLEGK